MVDDDNDNEPEQQTPKLNQKRLWGLVVCHHETPRFVPFPLRYACKFLMQAFAIHVNKKFELENQIREKNVLRTQTLLCDLLLQNVDSVSILSQSPNIIDLVRCDGAALLYQNKVWRLGSSPTDAQIFDIASWLSESHMDSTGMSTDSMYDAGYPGALALDEIVCRMVAARITSYDILFWFRSHVAAEVRWGGAKHDASKVDDGRRMHPRSSFKAFFEVVKMRSSPWSDVEMDAIHSLQLILRGTLDDDENARKKVSLDSRIRDIRLEGMLELEAVTNEMVRLIESAMVPILVVGVDGMVYGWNRKIAELTGLPIDRAIGKHLLTLVKDYYVVAVKKMIYSALKGNEEQNVQFQLKTHGDRANDGPIFLIVNACVNRDLEDHVVGVYFIAHDMTDHKTVMDKFTWIEGDYKAIVQNPNPLIPPIFGADEFWWCSEWNSAMGSFSRWERGDVMDNMLLGEVFGTNIASCRLKNQDALVNLSIIVSIAMVGQETVKAPFAFVNRDGKNMECLLSVSRKVNGHGVVSGVFCFLHDASLELQQVLHVQQLSEQTTMKKLKALSYFRHEIKNPLSGITYSRKMLEGTHLGEEHKQLLSTGEKCHLQLDRIIDGMNIESIMDS